MATIKADGIVLTSTDYNEADKLITCYLFSHGKITAKVRGCRKPKAKLKSAAISMNYGEFVINEKNNFYTVTAFNQKKSFSDSSVDLNKYFGQTILLEYLQKTSLEKFVNDDIARIVLDGIEQIALSDDGSDKYVVFYVLKLLEKSGYELDFNYSAKDGELLTGEVFEFFPRDSCIANVDGVVNFTNDSILLSLQALKQLRWFKSAKFADLDKIKSNKVETSEIFLWLFNYILCNIEVTINSIKLYLKQV